jgi:hypothetical protein
LALIEPVPVWPVVPIVPDVEPEEYDPAVPEEGVVE